MTDAAWFEPAGSSSDKAGFLLSVRPWTALVIFTLLSFVFFSQWRSPDSRSVVIKVHRFTITGDVCTYLRRTRIQATTVGLRQSAVYLNPYFWWTPLINFRTPYNSFQICTLQQMTSFVRVNALRLNMESSPGNVAPLCARFANSCKTMRVPVWKVCVYMLKEQDCGRPVPQIPWLYHLLVVAMFISSITIVKIKILNSYVLNCSPFLIGKIIK